MARPNREKHPQDKATADETPPKADSGSTGRPASLPVITDYLLTSGLAERSLQAGSYAPGFRLQGADGREWSSQTLLGRGPLVLIFFCGLWCEECNRELRALERARESIEARGATLVAISQQTVSNNVLARDAAGAGFPILNDRGGKVSSQFGVRWRVPEALRSLYLLHGIDLPALNGDSSWTFSIQARFVLGRNGLVAYSEINLGNARSADPSDLFPVLDALRHASAA